MKAQKGSAKPSGSSALGMECCYCRKPLSGLQDKELEGRWCPECGVVWLEKKCARKIFGDYLKVSQWSGSGPLCPRGCGNLKRGDVAGVSMFRCSACGGVLLEREAARKAAESLGGNAGMLGAAVYVLSLPERVGRGVAGSFGGLMKEAVFSVVPKAMRKSRFYDITFEKLLRFIIEDIGRVEGAYADGEGSGRVENYAVRKAVGNVVEMAGLATLHVSPVWGLAVLSDCALGARTYLKQLAEELRTLGVISEDAVISDVDSLLNALENSTGSLADRMDTPPLSVTELRKTVDIVRKAVAETDVSHVADPKVLGRLWGEMRDLARRENRSLFSISSAVSMDVMARAQKVGLGLYGSVSAGFMLVERNIFDYYTEGFRKIREDGYWQTVYQAYRPYTEALRKSFAPRRLTLTEKLLSGRFLSRIFRRKRRKAESGALESKDARGNGEKTADKNQD